MAVSRERFAQGFTYDQYRDQMTRNQDRFDDTAQGITLPAAYVDFYRSLPKPVNILVLAEDWCGDVIANLPVLGRLAEAGGKVNIRVFLRDQNLDIMDQYLKEGQFRSIPVFVLFDDEFNELGYWIERPAKITKLMQETIANMYATDPLFAQIAPGTSPGEMPEDARARFGQVMTAFRTENRQLAVDEVLRELQEIIKGTKSVAPEVIPVSAGAQEPAWKRATRAPAEQPIKVSITYCAECGYEPQTIALVSALIYEFRADLASVELIPWHDGAFDVVVDGELVHSMTRDGGFPEDKTILDFVKSRLGAAQPA